MIKLSILICSIEQRKDKLQILLNTLNKQKTDEIQILTEVDNRQMTIGAKRNKLLERAQGDFICFVDDDDSISENYCNLILNKIKENSNITHCSLRGYFIQDNLKQQIFQHSNKYVSWQTNHGAKIKYTRFPNHLNAIKRELALKIKFKQISFKQDLDFSTRVKDLCVNEGYIDQILYYYKYDSMKRKAN